MLHSTRLDKSDMAAPIRNGASCQVSYRVVDLFSGCGGFSLGAEWAGLTPTVAFDLDQTLTSSFARNHPHTRLVNADLGSTSGAAIMEAAGGRVEGIFGGPPCQGFSAIGRRQVSDPRRTLVSSFFRLVKEIEPAFFIMENVRGLGFASARDVLAEGLQQVPSKYEVLPPIILDAADFGAATRRSRLFVIGYDPSRFGPLTAEDIHALKTSPTSVRDAISDLEGAEQLADGSDRWQIAQRDASAYAQKLRSPDLVFSGNARTHHTASVIERFASVKPGTTDKVGRHYRLDWEGQCPTLRAGTGSDHGSYQAVRPIHPDEPRVITVREAARLQGFPDRFDFHPTIWHSFRMIGNSVSPIISEAIFSLIVQRIDPSERIAAE